MKSKLSRKILPLVVLLLAVAVFGFQLNRHIDDPIRADEAAWIFSSAYLNHYIAGDWNHRDWKHMDAIDHPPVAKYYYGLAVHLAGESWKSIYDKGWWFRSSQKIDPKIFQAGMEDRISKKVLSSCRIAAALAAVLACLTLYFLGSTLGGPSLGLTSSIFFILSRLVFYYVPIVEPDFLLMAITLMQAAFLVRWMKTLNWRDALMAGILIGVAIDTKLSGLIQVPVSVLAIVFVLVSSRFDRRAVFQSSMILVTGFAMMILLNPVLHSPIGGLIGMVEHRELQAAAVSQLSGLSELSSIQSIVIATRYLFIDFGLIIDGTWHPIGAILCIIGGFLLIYRCIRSKRCSISALCVVFMALLWGALSYYSFSKTLWLRYLLPISPYLALLMGYSMLMKTRKAT